MRFISYPTLINNILMNSTKKLIVSTLLLTVFSISNAHACRYMKSKNYIPNGYHPTSAEWKNNYSTGDRVCIAKTEGSTITFVSWHDFKIPSGYYILRELTPRNHNTHGCRQTISNTRGSGSCIATYNRYILKKSD